VFLNALFILYILFISLITNNFALGLSLYFLVIHDTFLGRFLALNGSRVASEVHELFTEFFEISIHLTDFLNQLVDEVVSVGDFLSLLGDSGYQPRMLLLVIGKLFDPSVRVFLFGFKVFNRLFQQTDLLVSLHNVIEILCGFKLKLCDLAGHLFMFIPHFGSIFVHNLIDDFLTVLLLFRKLNFLLNNCLLLLFVLKLRVLEIFQFKSQILG
jgi:hypothetical protein